MNKQELIKELKEEKRKIEWKEDKYELHNAASGGKERAYSLAIDLAKKLDEPKKVIVPKFVADFIEKIDYSFNKDLDIRDKAFVLYDLIISIEASSDMNGKLIDEKSFKYSKELHEWLSSDLTNIFKLSDAMSHGYEVEKKQLYYVDFIKNDDVHKRLVFDHENGKYNIVDWSDNLIGLVQEIFTEQEIKSIDERYWPFAVKVGNE
ncbi:DUF1642 domain-containing protein [Enterococcus faecalis]|uniref:DUF1642 domain-containing protein n=1 Tax=Enterobacteriaceae TaxID=543 RepID=UPI0012B7131A|nr:MULTISPECIES: DUF1642 domain-containing protein [Enterobacteriaceae]EJM6076914.1 DUF1642 domain-containing protein [Enterococcus faecalis]